MIRAFECSVKGTNWKQVVHHATAGKAKYSYWRDVAEAWPEVKYTDVTCRVLGEPRTSESFLKTATYRNVPFAKIGMQVEVNGNKGVIVGKNSSANFDILFQTGTHAGHVVNCHPNWMIKYFDSDGNLIQGFND